MIQTLYRCGFLAIILLLSQNIYAQKNSGSLQKVVIIRHGEKPETGDNLSCQGLNRAMQLPVVLYAKYKIADHIFVPSLKLGKSTNVARMFETIVPYSVKYNLNIDTRFEVDDAGGLVKEILKKDGTILVVWEHNNIIDIAKAFGIKGDLKWKDSDFDSIWIITFQNGKPVLSMDKENITPSADCK